VLFYAPCVNEKRFGAIHSCLHCRGDSIEGTLLLPRFLTATLRNEIISASCTKNKRSFVFIYFPRLVAAFMKMINDNMFMIITFTLSFPFSFLEIGGNSFRMSAPSTLPAQATALPSLEWKTLTLPFALCSSSFHFFSFFFLLR
jgi:hypothetical protein